LPRSSPCAYTPRVSHKSPTSPVKELSIDLKRDLLTLVRSSVVLRTPKILALGYNPRDDVVVACGINMIEFLRVGLNRMGQVLLVCCYCVAIVLLV